ncbi:uncharacterized protein LOC107371001 [Tetranychus urticae]|nr:uncharacterized protein LOC107371001 [Tetranychus urticae]
MNLITGSVYLTLTFICIELISSIEGAVPSKEVKKKPRPKKKKPDYKNKYHCLVCLADYSNKRINFKDTCINPAVNVSDAEAKYLTVCPSDTTLCAYELVTINDVFTAIERRCATSCTPSCFQSGYGTEKTICTYCCNKSIKPEDFNDDTVYEYICAGGLNGSMLTNFGLTLLELVMIIPSLQRLFKYWLSEPI